MEGMFEGTGLTALDLDKDPQSAFQKKMGKFEEADLQNAYARAQSKYDETFIIADRSRQIGSKLQAQTKTAPSPGFNMASDEDPCIISGLTQEDVEDEYISLLGGASLAIDPAEDDI